MISPVRYFLLPFSMIYGLIIWIRNTLFNTGILESRSFDIPVFSIGNITVGGTGKTPHTEYLIRALLKDYQVAVLSRGYKRKTKGFVLGETTSRVSEIGDEPLQLKRKFPELIVAVDENRRRGIEKLMDSSMKPFVDLVLLDDAYQHRYVHPSISILLIDYNRLLCNDFLLPVGSLREPAAQMKRAQIVVVSKCPSNLKPMDLRVLSTKINILPYQSLFFTTMSYGALSKVTPFVKQSEENTFNNQESLSDAVFGENGQEPDPQTIHGVQSLDEIREKKIPVLLLTGIATPGPLVEHLKKYTNEMEAMHFSDHHDFSKRDAKKITQIFSRIREKGGIILTTEKDAARIRQNPHMEPLSHYMYYPSLEVLFLDGQGKVFEQKITDYVRNNKRNRRLS